jgi:DNA polymerase sigma
LGIQSCLLVQSFLKEFPFLREVAIVMKKFMAKFYYNHPYNGKYFLKIKAVFPLIAWS